MGHANGDRADAKAELVGAFSAFGDDALRDVWLFDQDDHEAAYLREDVERKIEDIEVERFVDNERYGYVTRDTYDDLYYTSYRYTVRGFGEFEQFRTFLADNGAKIGVFASFDPRESGYDYRDLDARIAAIVTDHPVEAFAPART